MFFTNNKLQLKKKKNAYLFIYFICKAERQRSSICSFNAQISAIARLDQAVGSPELDPELLMQVTGTELVESSLALSKCTLTIA